MRRDILFGEGGTLLRGPQAMDLDKMLDSIAAHRSTSTAEKERTGRRRALAIAEVSAERLDGLGGKRSDAFLAALSSAAYVGGTAVEVDVFERECGDLGDAQSSLDREEQERVVATTKRRRLVRRG